ncbi:MAG TPA: DUF6588 family protein [Longimicrobiales bacterium]|nr:DUF6588 family protein [Longimicrobiales bacterium]
MHIARRAAAAALVALATAAVAGPASAQDGDLSDRFATLALRNAELYVEPIALGLGQALTSGFAETGSTHRVLGFDIGLRAMAAFPTDAQKTFTAVLPESVEYRGMTFNDPFGPQGGGSLDTPTAVGAGDGVVLVPQGTFRLAIIAAGENPNDYNIEFPEGLDIPAVPFAILQGSVGLPFGTEVTLRMIPSITPDEEIGAVSAFGFGLKHSVTQWLPASPVDVSVYVGRQNFEVGDYLDATSTVLGAIGSRSLGPLTAFAHVRSSGADVTVSYTVENPDDNPALPEDGSRVGFDANVPTAMHAGAGVTLRVLGMGITGEYSFGPQNTATIKAGLSIR